MSRSNRKENECTFSIYIILNDETESLPLTPNLHKPCFRLLSMGIGIKYLMLERANLWTPPTTFVSFPTAPCPLEHGGNYGSFPYPHLIRLEPLPYLSPSQTQTHPEFPNHNQSKDIIPNITALSQRTYIKHFADLLEATKNSIHSQSKQKETHFLQHHY